MLIIGICDADTTIRVILSDFIKKYKEQTGVIIQVLSYDNGEKLLAHYPLEMDLIFLEIPFKRMNGIEIAKKIRSVDSMVNIVFLTTVLNRAFEAYKVKANNYLIKPLKYSSFLKEIEEVRNKKGHKRFFIESNARGVYKIYIKSITHIETIAHNTNINTELDCILSYKRMKEHEAILFERYFIRCHSGYIVNLLFFEKLENNDIILTTQKRIPISRQKRNEVLNRIKELFIEGDKV